MAKRDDQFVQDEVLEQDVDSTTVTEADAAKREAFLASKREAAKRFAERKAAEKQERIEKSKEIIESMKTSGSWDSLADHLKTFLENMANPPVRTAAAAGTTGGNNSIFNKLFGENPQVGATITLRAAFEATMKGKAQIDAYTKKWAKNGTIVSYKPNAENVFESVYTIDAIGSGAVDAE